MANIILLPEEININSQLSECPLLDMVQQEVDTKLCVMLYHMLCAMMYRVVNT